jgi:hypothetical protein
MSGYPILSVGIPPKEHSPEIVQECYKAVTPTEYYTSYISSCINGCLPPTNTQTNIQKILYNNQIGSSKHELTFNHLHFTFLYGKKLRPNIRFAGTKFPFCIY